MDYSNYLKLPQLLSLQELESHKRTGQAAHNEMLFIIIHQSYELWFKQILHEVMAIKEKLGQPFVQQSSLSFIVSKLKRVNIILQQLVDQISIMETLSTVDFLEFRHHLVPASGFQSVQFRQLEAHLGLKFSQRMSLEKAFLKQRLDHQQYQQIEQLDQSASLLELVDTWLARFPLLEQKEYWQDYQAAVEQMLDLEAKIISNNTQQDDRQIQFEQKNLQMNRQHFQVLFDEKAYQDSENKISRKAMLSALFIHLNRDYPLLALPFQLLEGLVEIDEWLTLWRQRHALMVQRILGNKVGTGGSSGHHYLGETVKKNRIFADFFNLTSFLLPQNQLPKLNAELKELLAKEI